jgi:hypothetical protein
MNGLEPDPAGAPHVYSTFKELHEFLTGEMSLLAEAEHGGRWRTYFFQGDRPGSFEDDADSEGIA